MDELFRWRYAPKLSFAVATIIAAFAMVDAARAWEMRVCADPYYMPFSNRDLEGYENKIATILADELEAELTFKWWPQTESMVSDVLRAGECDMIMGVPDSEKGVLPTLAYYQSPYVFVYRTSSDHEIASFDDAILKELQLGVQSTLDRPHGALGMRGLANNVVLQFFSRPEDENGPFAPLIEAVAEGEIDVAVPWGPAGGYFGNRQAVELTVTPVPTFDLPFTPMYISVVIAVRRGDEALRDRLDLALAARWDDILAVLEEYDVPTIPIARPVGSLEGGQQ